MDNDQDHYVWFLFYWTNLCICGATRRRIFRSDLYFPLSSQLYLGLFCFNFWQQSSRKMGFFYSYFSYSYNCNIESFQLFPSTSPGKLDPTTPSCKTCNLFTLYSNWRKKLTLLIKKVPAKSAWNYACGLYILTAFFYLFQ